MKSKWTIRLTLWSIAVGAMLIWAGQAEALTITFGGATGLRATIDVTQTAPNQLTISAKNTSTPGATTGSANRVILVDPDCFSAGTILPALPNSSCRLLASFGWAFDAITKSISGGSAVIPAGSVGSGDPAGPGGPFAYPAGTVWSSEWGFANDAPPNAIGTYDFISTNTGQATQFCTPPGCPNRDGADGLDGPQAGILSATWASASGLGYVQDTLEFVITFSAHLTSGDLTALENAKWFVEFGSGTTGLTNGRIEEVAESGTLALLGIGLLALVGAGQMRRRELGLA